MAKKKNRIFTEINCLQKQPIVTTISNSENYYWALPYLRYYRRNHRGRKKSIEPTRFIS